MCKSYQGVEEGTLCIRCLQTDATEEGQLCAPCARPADECPPPVFYDCCYLCANPLPKPIPYGKDSRCGRCKDLTRSMP